VDLARGVGRAAGELKAVPQEFEKGLQKGEEAALKAKENKGSVKAPAAADKDGSKQDVGA
jgi:Sec-independent protein translocase protein TatA